MNSNIKKEIINHIDSRREEIVEFLRKLISFPSITGNELGIQQFVAQKLEEMNLEIDMWEPNHDELKKHPAYVYTAKDYTNRPNVVGIYHGTGNGRSLLFNGHVDVIPVEPINAWNYNPWGGVVEGDRMYGRGTSDMKSGLAAMTMALYFLLDLGVKIKGDIILEYVVDEEQTGNGTLACVMKGYKADAGICCETSSMQIQPGCIGRIWFDVIIKGKPTGIQRAWEGVNAIEKGYNIMKAISEFGNKRVCMLNHPLYPNVKNALPCMVGVFKAGTFPSSFPDNCLLQGSFATLPGENNNEVKKELENHVLNHAKNDDWLKDHLPIVEYKGYSGDPAEIPKDHPIVKTVEKNHFSIIGQKASITGREGAADIRYLIKYGSTPTVIFGPGLTELMHATDEYVKISNLISATKILALTILDWCGYEDEY